MATGITFSGLASGIDTTAIVTALVDVASRPINALEKTRGELEKAKGLFVDLDGKLDKLEEATRKIGNRSSFLTFAAESSNDKVLTASASGSALSSSYTIDVGQLARAGSQQSQVYANADTLTVGTGTLEITVGTTDPTVTAITIDGSSNTLETLVGAINDSDADVTASLVATTPTGDYKLIVTSNETGEENEISLDTTGLTGGDQALTFSTLQAALDAQITVNGLDVSRSTNTINDVIDGVTLDLVATGTSSLTVKPDIDAVKETIQGFVNDFNAVQGLIQGQLRFDPAFQEAPPLLGDFTLRGLESRFGNVITSAVAGSGVAASLGLIGISTNGAGLLEIDDDELTELLEDELDSVTSLFTTETDGVADRIQSVIDDAIDPVDGSITTRTDSLVQSITDTNDRIFEVEGRVAALEQGLRLKYAAFESLMSTLQAQQNLLSQQLQRR